MIRRAFLLGASGAGLAACTTASVDAGLATAASDVATIAAALPAVLTQLGTLSIPGLTPAIVATVGVAVSGIQTVASALSGAATAAAAQPLVAKVETYVNGIVTALAGLPLPPPISTALTAASILLPVIEAAIGLVTTPAPAAARMAASAPSMSPAQARLILKGIAVSK
jgi:hypothetical protein